MNKIKKYYRIISPQGDITEPTNVFKFCKKAKLDSSAMFNVANGRRKHHKGWRMELIKNDNIVNNGTSKSNKGVLQFTGWISTNIKRIYTTVRSWGKK